MAKAITASQILNIIKNQEYRCALSGRQLKPETSSVDHIVPLAKGGTHDITNIWVVDHKINVAKGTMPVDEFVMMCRDVVKYQDKHGNRTLLSADMQAAVPAAGPPEKLLF
jgi:5-methylcytosine-specific restriction endonuclease McrA